MTAKKSWYPFTAEQTVNLLGEFGPLITMFIVNAIWDIDTGVKALIGSTLLAMIAMLVVLRRLPVFPIVAGTITVIFGALTLVTGNPMWVQIKVTIFNVVFALILWIGLWMGRNFFKYIFGKTFHYTDEGWTKFTNHFAGFFIFTALINEAVRLGFANSEFIVLNKAFDGVQIWIFFKVFVVMPLGGLFAWWQTRLMKQYKLPDPIDAGIPGSTADLGRLPNGAVGANGMLNELPRRDDGPRHNIVAQPTPGAPAVVSSPAVGLPNR